MIGDIIAYVVIGVIAALFIWGWWKNICEKVHKEPCESKRCANRMYCPKHPYSREFIKDLWKQKFEMMQAEQERQKRLEERRQQKKK